MVTGCRVVSRPAVVHQRARMAAVAARLVMDKMSRFSGGGVVDCATASASHQMYTRL
jgi:hypothetical protein